MTYRQLAKLIECLSPRQLDMKVKVEVNVDLCIDNGLGFSPVGTAEIYRSVNSIEATSTDKGPILKT